MKAKSSQQRPTKKIADGTNSGSPFLAKKHNAKNIGASASPVNIIIPPIRIPCLRGDLRLIPPGSESGNPLFATTSDITWSGRPHREQNRASLNNCWPHLGQNMQSSRNV